MGERTRRIVEKWSVWTGGSEVVLLQWGGDNDKQMGGPNDNRQLLEGKERDMAWERG